MDTHEHIEVAVLLATYNGSKYIEQQIRSLAENVKPFTLHWLDDHSADDTRKLVRACVQNANISLREWHQPQHQGLPDSYFQLLECVEADVYLFCDQDDIWQPGKIDATVNYLACHIGSPALCYSDSILYYEGGLKRPCRFSQLRGIKDLARASRQPPTFLCFSPVQAAGHTQGFTRSLREIYLTHRDLARKYAPMHDLWMHDIAVAAGTVHMLVEAPTVLWRQHLDSYCGRAFREPISNRITARWRGLQRFRRIMSRHLQGVALASQTLPAGRERDRLLELAKLVANIDQRQTMSELASLVRRGAKFPRWSVTALLFLACLCSAATSHEPEGRVPVR